MKVAKTRQKASGKIVKTLQPAQLAQLAQVAIAALFVQVAAHAQPVWLTVIGDPEVTTVNTIQVDPAPLEVSNEFRTMRIRVSRSLPRTSWDGTPYRSYESIVQFDCSRNKARYMMLTYYADAVWRGDAFKTTDYSTGPARLMEFRDVTPNPNQRILRAACLGISRPQ